MHTWYTHTYLTLDGLSIFIGRFCEGVKLLLNAEYKKKICLDSEFNSVWVKVIDRNKLWIMWWCTHVNVRSNQWLRRFFFFLFMLLLFLLYISSFASGIESIFAVCLPCTVFFQWKKNNSIEANICGFECW